MSWLFGAHFLYRDTLLSLDTGRRAWVRHQCSDGIDFIDSPWETIHSLRRWEQARGRCGEPDKGEEGELGLICKIKKQTKKPKY